MTKYFGFIYEWVDSTNDKNYVGSHKGLIDDGYTGSGTYFLSAFKKRPDEFSREILEYVYEDDRKILLEVEQKYLDLIDWNNTYNISTIALGSDGMIGKHHTNESKKIMSEKAKKRPSNHTGKKHTEEFKIKIGNIHRGKIVLEETKQKMSKSKLGEKNHMYGIPCSEERRKNISESRKGKPWSKIKREAYNTRKLNEI